MALILSLTRITAHGTSAIVALCFLTVLNESFAQTPINGQEQIDEANIVYDESGLEEDKAPLSTAAGDLPSEEKSATKTLGPSIQVNYPLESQEDLLAKELLKTLHSDQVVWLTTGDTKALAIWHAEHSGTPRGAALILPPQGITAADQSIISNLQINLAKNGWSNLTIGMPRSKNEIKPPRPKALPTDSTKELITPAKTINQEESAANKAEDQEIPPDKLSNTEEPTSNDEIQVPGDNSAPESTSDGIDNESPAQQQAIVRITAGLNHLQMQNQFNNVIIAFDSNAKRALDYISELQENKIQLDSPPSGIRMSFPLRAIAIVNIHHRLDRASQQQILDSIKTISIPILDLTYQSHHSLAPMYQDDFAEARRNNAGAAGIETYIQRKISPPVLQVKGESRMTKVIRGFFHRHAGGVEDEKR